MREAKRHLEDGEQQEGEKNCNGNEDCSPRRSQRSRRVVLLLRLRCLRGFLAASSHETKLRAVFAAHEAPVAPENM